MASPKAAGRYCSATWWQKSWKILDYWRELAKSHCCSRAVSRGEGRYYFTKLWMKIDPLFHMLLSHVLMAQTRCSLAAAALWRWAAFCSTEDKDSGGLRGHGGSFPTTNWRTAVMSPGNKMAKYILVKSFCTGHLFPILFSVIEWEYCNFFHEGERSGCF